MKKAVWITFLVALVLVNLLAWIAESTTDVEIALPFRLTIVLGITFVSAVFTGAYFLVRQADKEKPDVEIDDKPPQD